MNRLITGPSGRPAMLQQATLQQIMQQAAGSYAAGEWAKAEQACERILAEQANHFDALNLLAIIAAQTRRSQRAADLFGRASVANPREARAHLNYGRALQELKRSQDALESYERALRLRPDYAEAHNNRGAVLQELGRCEEALRSYQRALTSKPQYAEAYQNRGNALCGLKRFEDALESYERALRIKPDFAEAYYNRGNALRELGRLEDALKSYVSALKIKPDYAEVYYDAGTVLQDLKRFEDALASYERALRINPDYAQAHNNRGNALQELKRFEQSLQSYDSAVKINPNYAEAYINRASVLRELKRFDEELENYAAALRIRPDYAEAYNNYGHALRELGRYEEALDSYARALTIKPDIHWLHGTWLHTKTQLCDWSDLDSQIANLVAKLKQSRKASLPFAAVVLTDCLAAQRQAAEVWANETSPISRALPPIDKRNRRQRIRVGYFSADYHNHATAYLTAELFERHNRNKFEVIAFSFGPESHDDMRTRLTAAFDDFVDVRRRSSREIAELSRAMQIDIAVDLKGFTRNERLGIFSHRAAPVQVNYLGYPGTLGVPYIDYIVADRTLIPDESRPHYSEKIVYLPNSYQVNDRKRQIADRRYSREELGLPSSGFVFCCFNNAYKIRAAVFDCWMSILKQIEDSVLWLLEDNPGATDNLRRHAEARGVNAARLVFARRRPLPEHLARHRAADLFLDTLPYNAHTTASDALWAGLPVLTCCGESFAARVSASLLSAIGLPELITGSLAHYEALAIELAAHPDRLAVLRDRLSANRLTAALFDTELFSRHIEQAYTHMYERYQLGLGPEDITVPP